MKNEDLKKEMHRLFKEQLYNGDFEAAYETQKKWLELEGKLGFWRKWKEIFLIIYRSFRGLCKKVAAEYNK